MKAEKSRRGAVCGVW